MIPFVRRADGVHLTLSPGERDLLASLVEQLLQILDGDVGADPVSRRMFPAAYRDDEDAAAEFRRYTFDDLRTGKRANAAVVRDSLTGSVGRAADGRTDGTVDSRADAALDGAAEQAWLRCLTDLRLTVAERLGITDADPEADRTGDDPDDGFGLRDVYDWLGYVQEGLVDVLMADRASS